MNDSTVQGCLKRLDIQCGESDLLIAVAQTKDEALDKAVAVILRAGGFDTPQLLFEDHGTVHRLEAASDNLKTNLEFMISSNQSQVEALEAVLRVNYLESLELWKDRLKAIIRLQRKALAIEGGGPEGETIDFV